MDLSLFAPFAPHQAKDPEIGSELFASEVPLEAIEFLLSLWILREKTSTPAFSRPVTPSTLHCPQDTLKFALQIQIL
jgi:hypothetical protein